MILDNFPKILWINLNHSVERRKYMEKLFETHDLNATRIPGINGELMDIEFRNSCIINKNYYIRENACTCSHLKALKYFIDNMSDDKIIIFEDDVSFDFLSYIPFNWSHLMSMLPSNYNIIQLATSGENVNLNLTEINGDSKSYGTIAYLITRNAAIQLLDKYYSKQFGRFVLANQKWVTADSALYSLPHTYRIPIFTYTNTDSTIHSIHLKKHAASKKQQLDALMHSLRSSGLRSPPVPVKLSELDLMH